MEKGTIKDIKNKILNSNGCDSIEVCRNNAKPIAEKIVNSDMYKLIEKSSERAEERIKSFKMLRAS